VWQQHGSSPRVWGEEDMIADNRIAERIIPTRVGRRTLNHSRQNTQSDHPHACGEKHTPC